MNFLLRPGQTLFFYSIRADFNHRLIDCFGFRGGLLFSLQFDFFLRKSTGHKGQREFSDTTLTFLTFG